MPMVAIIKPRIVASKPSAADFPVSVDTAVIANNISVKYSAGPNLSAIDDNGTANTVTIDGNASEAIDGALTYVLTQQYESVSIVCGNGGWHII